MILEAFQEKTRLALVFALGALFVIEGLYLLAFVSASRAYDVFAREEQQLKTLFGDRALPMMASIREKRSRWVDPVLDEAREKWDPAKAQQGVGMSRVSSRPQEWVQTRLLAMQTVGHGVLQRFHMMAGALLLAWPLIVAAALYALTRRKRAIAVDKTVSAVHYHASRHATFWLFALPLIGIALPIPWPPYALHAWVVCLTAALYLSLRNVQEG
jgi:hypothetical protein